MQLDSRKMKILELIIDKYIKSGDPVGSKTISQLLQNSVSSATIRNEMARLYELGFLEQPHTSSGRIPSQLGYRLYVDKIMKKKSLSRDQTRQIESWFNIKDLDCSYLIKNSGKILSQITMCMTILSSMVFKSLIITKIEIIGISSRTLTIILVTSAGIVKSKVCKVDFDLNIDTMDFIYKFINNFFSGKSVEEVSRDYINSIVTNLDNYQHFFIPIFYNVFEMCKSLQTSDFYMDGQTNLLFYKELKDVAADIIEILSDKKIVSDIIDDLNIYYKSGVARVRFGRELRKAELANICVIVSKYNIGDIGTGNILVIGPGRIDYAALVPWVEYFSNMLSVVLSESLEVI